MRKYLRPEDLRRLRHLFFTSRRRVEGAYAGAHVSPHRGHSVEFADYRPYMPGDEIGDIDWKVYGRTDRLFVKLFEHHSDMTVHLMLDASASMAFAGAGDMQSGSLSKYDYAAHLAAAIAFLTLQQRDQVSLSVAQEGVKLMHPPSAAMAQLHAWTGELERIEPTGEAKLAAALKQVAQTLARRGVLIVVSDLLDEREALLDALALFTHRGSDVALFHVLHSDELSLPDLDQAVFIDSETGQRAAAEVPNLRDAYAASMKDFIATWAGVCRARGIDYQLVSTGTDYVNALERYWRGRGRSRGR